MGLQDRDYMRSARRVKRASDQRAPGDPRSGDEVFLPGTVHAQPRRSRTGVIMGVCAIVAVVAILLVTS